MLPLKDNVPTRSFPVVTVGIIVANFVVWFWELSGPGLDDRVVRYGYYPCTVQGPCVAPATERALSWWDGTFTAMFMHGGWVHILGNMLFLWIFGNNIEDALGRVRFVVYYLLAGIAADGLQTLVTLQYSGTADASIPNIGASGAIAGVLGGYLLLLPRAKVLTLIFGWILREIRAFWFLGIWFAFQLWQGNLSITHPEEGGGVAFFAHIGGFVFGMATVFLFAKRRPLQPSY